MRDVNRIPMLMWKLQEYWMRNPDLRLGQMMIIAEKRLELDDVWNVEDEELVNAIVDGEDDDIAKEMIRRRMELESTYDEKSVERGNELLEKVCDILQR